MIEHVPVQASWTLNDYSAISLFAQPVRDLRMEASVLAPALRDRTVWMINSTARGGGVAEMMPRMVTLLSELGIKTRWVVMGSDRPEFFALTKRLHNLIHGEGDPSLGPEDRELFEAVNAANAEELAPEIGPEDLVVIHDPQPLAMGWMLRRKLDARTIWRCHIGLDEHTLATRAAWNFLRPYAETHCRAIFSVPEYIPDYLAGRSTIIHPALDPCSHKNRELFPHKLVGILCNAGLIRESHPVLTSAFSEQAKRLGPDGEFGPVVNGGEIGLLFRPLVTQVSRWDRLKGFRPLLDGFLKLKERVEDGDTDVDPRHRRRLELVRLVLAGPDPSAIQDDPEGIGVLNELVEVYRGLPKRRQEDVVLLTLPMTSRKENALMVNALQRCSTVIVQNSLREGFGLSATEGMWKEVPVVGTRACGLRQQIRSGIDGVLIQDPQDSEEIARRLDDVLENVPKRDAMARSARERVHHDFLVFKQMEQWLRVLNACATAPRGRGASESA